MRIHLLMLVTLTILLVSCANAIRVRDPDVLINETGIIGVFRQPIGSCSGGYAQGLNVSGKRIYVKRTWTSDQDNLFSFEFPSGKVKLRSFTYGCGSTLSVIDLSQISETNEYPVLYVPVKGFCKVTLSLLSGTKFIDTTDNELIKNKFVDENISLSADDLPFCKTKK